jgi:ribosomal protein S18 acetylase RimI-like enzyme
MCADKPSTETAPNWQPARSEDLDSINNVADSIHLDLPERPEVFAEKFNLSPRGCYVLKQDGATLGYGLSHPWMLNDIPPLDTFLRRLPATPGCLYVHDVAILPRVRSHGSAGKYIDLMAELAKAIGISSLALVSVYGTDTLWARYGFKVVFDAALVSKLASYGDTAKYMIRKL